MSPMRYPLLSRFRGAIAGAHLGKMWALRVASSPDTAFWVLEQAADIQELHTSNPFGNSLLVELVSQQLLESGRLTFDENSEAGLTIPWADGNTTQWDADVWIALLPIVLFFHEDDARLALNLQQVAKMWQFPSEAIEAVLGVGYAIALVLRENLNPATLSCSLFNYLNASEGDSLSLQFPSVLKIFLDDGLSLESVRRWLGRQTSPPGEFSPCTQAVALALYCFLGTPGDLRTCLMRSLQVRYQPQLVATIVGAIAGAYNSDAGIPLSWRVALSAEGESRSWQLATQLWAAWSGICDPMMPLNQLEEMAAITAPGVLRPR